MKKVKTAVLTGCAVCLILSAGFVSYRYQTELLAEKYYEDLRQSAGPKVPLYTETDDNNSAAAVLAETKNTEKNQEELSVESEVREKPDLEPMTVVVPLLLPESEETKPEKSTNVAAAAEEENTEKDVNDLPSAEEEQSAGSEGPSPDKQPSDHGNGNEALSDGSTGKTASPVDFNTLQEINPWIYAWIDIPGSKLSYPIVQHPIDDLYYLNHSVDNSPSALGAIFTFHDSERDLSRFNTIIYGHNCSGSMLFGYLNSYMNWQYLQDHREIDIYTPEKKLTYTVFAAVTYSDVLINTEFDDNSTEDRQRYIDSLYGLRNLDSILMNDVEVTPESHLITLSTCIDWRPEKRWLVVAVLNDD